ncbi:MAG: hypothetical protein DWB56_06865 [Candidatus Jettenia sp.]|uniref:hypothetical protein n=1 Tax=Candidatus Jettenia sp. AMX1 TaxID=2293637 RepID=UPI00058F95D6|nr:hypothetical protein [Candidatus Jettenia sp. AMX1]MBC6928675.1 hypothetical protein [Candidatus Jettenia sp.]GJQ44288.1 MAG: hypothetical protein JETCAE04_00420 [Candidatus Jettenia caeni]KAA0250653.1 MAG: hypothetical protein EDM77_03805 [Candidatus Jettenia sp. AMX1]MCE7879987.1 hypothetical protein [Candidatus Jettenia sp. AMX1]MCQ3926769.1 hypothetical protein [Candidatus Jettenia sp.]
MAPGFRYEDGAVFISFNEKERRFALKDLSLLQLQNLRFFLHDHVGLPQVFECLYEVYKREETWNGIGPQGQGSYEEPSASVLFAAGTQGLRSCNDQEAGLIPATRCLIPSTPGGSSLDTII